MIGWINPRLEVTFGLNGKDLELRDRNGRLFEPITQVFEERDAARLATHEAQQRAEQARQRAEREHQRAEEED